MRTEETPRSFARIPALIVALIAACAAAYGQNTQIAAAAAGSDVRSTYVLGPGDQVSIQALEAEEIAGKPFRIDPNGYLRLPMAGRILAVGLTVEQLENSIAERLKQFIKQPDVIVTILEYRSQPVSVLGSVRSPGVHQLQGRKTLIDVLSDAGGIADDAGHSVMIVRRSEWGRIPLASARNDETGQFSVAEVDTKRIMDASDPASNIVICPQDVITIPRAEMVYVVGAVPHGGGFVLQARQSLSALQAYTLAGGADKAASIRKARILRPAAGGSRTEIAVDLSKILAGKSPDVPLKAEDILFIPSSNSRKALARAEDVATLVATGLIYRLP